MAQGTRDKVPRVHHPIFSRLLARMVIGSDERGGAEHRAEALVGLSGRVIEIGAGNGLNFRHYPSAVTEVVATEPEAYLRGLGEEAAAGAPVPVRMVDWAAEELGAEDASFDAGVASLVLCSVHDPELALAELLRVIKPGGELRYYEHIRADTPGLARAQRIFDAIGLPHVVGGDHLSRRTDIAIREAGFAVERERHFRFSPQLANTLVAPHVLGVARRPEPE